MTWIAPVFVESKEERVRRQEIEFNRSNSDSNYKVAVSEQTHQRRPRGFFECLESRTILKSAMCNNIEIVLNDWTPVPKDMSRFQVYFEFSPTEHGHIVRSFLELLGNE